MATRYYYFQSVTLPPTASITKQLAAGALFALVAPTATSVGFIVVQIDDTSPNEDDLFAEMSFLGLTFVQSTLVAPAAFVTVRDYGSRASAPTVPAPVAGDRYYDSTIGWPLVYDGVSWRGIQFVEIPFTFATGSPLVISSLRNTDFAMRSEIVIDTVFDGAGAALQLGTGVSPGGILSTADITVTQTYTQRSFDRFTVGATTNIILTITPGGGATSGAGRVFLEIWRA